MDFSDASKAELLEDAGGKDNEVYNSALAVHLQVEVLKRETVLDGSNRVQQGRCKVSKSKEANPKFCFVLINDKL